jgi:hypothetical protein
MLPALPGTRGLFSVLQDALSRGDKWRVRLNQHVYDTAADFHHLLDSLASRPTRVQELVPTPPLAIGASDACQRGMGGVWLDAQSHSAIAHKDVLAHDRNVRKRTVWIASDNQAAVSWSTKGSSTSLATRAYLLRYNALHQRCHRYLPLHHYIHGPVNAMADDASCRWDLHDEDLPTHFDHMYPQTLSWQLQHLPSETNASLTRTLCRKRPSSALLDNGALRPKPVGPCGPVSVKRSAWMPSPWEPTIASPSSSSMPNATAPGPSPPAATLSALAQWRTPYERWARRMPGWGPLTLA